MKELLDDIILVAFGFLVVWLVAVSAPVADLVDAVIAAVNQLQIGDQK